MAKKIILSGMRPTGKLHLGNYVGVLANWVKLQDEYQCFFEVADWHALTTGYEKTDSILEDGLEVVLDWLAAGIDPHKSVVFVQSDVKEHAELHLLLSMLITTARLERNPTLKEQVRDLAKLLDSSHEDVREEAAQALRKAGFDIETVDRRKKKYRLKGAEKEKEKPEWPSARKLRGAVGRLLAKVRAGEKKDKVKAAKEPILRWQP